MLCKDSVKFFSHAGHAECLIVKLNEQEVLRESLSVLQNVAKFLKNVLCLQFLLQTAVIPEEPDERQ